MSEALPLVFAVIMAGTLLTYVLLDGYSLGVGILMAVAKRSDQDRMVISIGPFWHANETWLVLGIGLLLVAFPAAHGEILGALYVPVAVMLVGLMLRGVAFELRIKAEGWHRELWNWLFGIGSTLTAFSQGLMLGRYVTGFASGFEYWVFALLVGASLCGGYALLGATWIILRTDGELQVKAARWARWGLWWIALGIIMVSAATPLVSQSVRDKWFTLSRMAYLPLFVIGAAGAWLWVWRSLGRSDTKPLKGAMAIFVLSFAGLAYSLFPYVVLDRMTIWQAAAHPSALMAVLVGTALVLPLIIAYTCWSYWVFRGKTAGGDPYG